jgi:ribosome-associated translation inhibitor RaiA
MMPVPLQFTARDVSLSQAAAAEIRAKAANLGTYYDRLTRCRVVVEGPGRHHRQGPYSVRIDLSVPGAELVVDRQTDEDLYVAIVGTGGL